VVSLAVQGYPHTRVGAPLHAKRALEVDAIMQAVFFDDLQKGLDHVVRALQVAGTADAYAKLYHFLTSLT
jgi:hypothetical protein